MSNTVTLTIDGQPVTVPTGTTILNAARGLGKDVPTICYHEHCTANALCRICVVEVEGARVLPPACVAQVSEGMKVATRNEPMDAKWLELTQDERDSFKENLKRT